MRHSNTILSIAFIITCNLVYGQDIINDIGTDGEFIVRDATEDTALVINKESVEILRDLKLNLNLSSNIDNNFVVWDPIDKKLKLAKYSLNHLINQHDNVANDFTGISKSIASTGTCAGLYYTQFFFIPNQPVSYATTNRIPGIYWDETGNKLKYSIHRTSGTWESPNYQQMKIAFRTGIIMEPGTGNNDGYGKSYVEITNGKGLRITQGTVGIGIANPTQLLDVADTIRTSGGIEFPDGTVQITAATGAGSGDNWGTQVVISDATLTGDGTSATPLSVVGGGTSDGDAWGVTGEDQSNPVGRTGNVGIGTTNPTAKLEVAGQVKITGGTPGDGKVLTSDANGLATWETPTSGGSSLWTESGGNIFRSDGNVGIGTTNPSKDLDVNGAVKAKNFVTTLNNLGNYSSGTITWDLTQGNIAKLFLGGDCTLNITGPREIGTYILIVEQTSTGDNELDFSGNTMLKFPNSTPPSLTNSPAYVTDILTFVSDGIWLYGVTTNNLLGY